MEVTDFILSIYATNGTLDCFSEMARVLSMVPVRSSNMSFRMIPPHEALQLERKVLYHLRSGLQTPDS